MNCMQCKFCTAIKMFEDEGYYACELKDIESKLMDEIPEAYWDINLKYKQCKMFKLKDDK